MDKVGIELVLKQNLETQLKAMLPLLERMNKQIEVMDMTLNRAKGIKTTNQALDTMNRHLKNVEQSTRNLNAASRQIDNLGNHAQRTAGKVGLLRRAFSGLTGAPMALAGMLGGFASVYTVGNMVSKGMDFEQQVKSLQLAGLTPEQLKAAQETAKRTAADRRFITTPTEVLESIRIGTAITRRPDEAIAMAPLGAQFNRAMRQIHAPGADEHNQAEFAYKMAEQLGVRDSGRMKELMDILTKVEIAFAGQLDMQKLTQQLSMTRTAKYGADLMPLMVQLGHIITEVGTSGGGTAGARAGMQIQALSRILAQGTMTQAVAARLGKLGLIGGYDEALAAKTKAGHTTLIDTTDGRHVLKSGSVSAVPHLTKGELGNLILTGLVGRELAIKDTPQWVEKYLVPAINKAEGVDLYKLSQGPQDDRTKAVSVLTKWLAGTQLNAQDLLTQLVLQHQVFGGQLSAAQKAPGMDRVMQQQMSMRNNLEQLQKAWDTFSITLTSNEHVMNLVNGTFKTLTDILLNFANNVDPLIKNLDNLLHGRDKPSDMASGMSNMSHAIFGGSTKGPNVGRIAWKNAKNALPAIISAALKYGVDPTLAVATALNESGLNPFSVGDHGTSFGLFQLHKGGELGKMSPQQAFDPITNAMTALSHFSGHGGLSGGALAAAAQRPLNPTAYAKAVDSLMPQARDMVLHADIHIGDKKIDSHIVNVTAKHQLKTMRQMSNATSGAGGSHTPNSYNSGGDQF